MTLTNTLRAFILSELKKQSLGKREFAEKCGYGAAWATKLFDGTLVTLSDEAQEKVESVLGVRLIIPTEHGRITGKALDFAKVMESDPRVAEIAELILQIKASPADPPAPARRNRATLGAFLLLAGACVGLLLGQLGQPATAAPVASSGLEMEVKALRAQVAELTARGEAIATAPGDQAAIQAASGRREGR